MFKDKLMTALNDAISNFNGGADENESVVKAASSHGFNPEQTLRLVESFNTAKTICFYKHADDRSAAFPTADPDAVIADLFGKKEEEKAASAMTDDSYEDYSYYEQNHPELGKRASVLDDYDPWAGFGGYDDSADREKLAEHERFARRQSYLDVAKNCFDTAGMASLHYDESVVKVAEEISRAHYYHPEIVDELHTYAKSLDKMGQAAVDAVFGYLPFDREKCRDLKISKLDVTHPMLTSSIKSAAEMLQESGVMAAQGIELEKMARELTYELGIVNAEEEEIDSFIPKSAQSLYGDALGQLGQAATREATTGAIGGVKNVIQKTKEEKNKKFTERARNHYRQLMLERLITTDPILKGADEESVLRAYESLVDIAPEVSLKEDVTRSILREAVTTASLSPYDAKSFVDLNEAIKKSLTANPTKAESDKK